MARVKVTVTVKGPPTQPNELWSRSFEHYEIDEDDLFEEYGRLEKRDDVEAFEFRRELEGSK